VFTNDFTCTAKRTPELKNTRKRITFAGEIRALLTINAIWAQVVTFISPFSLRQTAIKTKNSEKKIKQAQL